MADEALRELKPRFSRIYAKTGRPSIAPEKLLRALLLQVLYSVRSERMLMEQVDYSLLFRWFVPNLGRSNSNGAIAAPSYPSAASPASATAPAVGRADAASPIRPNTPPSEPTCAS